ncbi:hypothetical protein BU26DRAFT_441419 [Trematosphaeria pertusa]|uniref:Uncharacterized protein n=1 Tax=Trematosphaeria pertusa TaxID=390896 RepID=A0A6A6HU31_9PLEO|nr:uncharacterized protein BU26DRAFT_441419 [Trematosphaeria pertusa]KAF2240930.1 hypothetical protein BU26DRAFT_441419 [Trematosphaeria pertusa]
MPGPIQHTASSTSSFAAQLAQLKQLQEQQSELLKELMQKAEEQDNIITEYKERTARLERAAEVSEARRREAVSHLLNLRTAHQEASNAFDLRTRDMQADDFESAIIAWGTMVGTSRNHHQQVLRHGPLRPASAQPVTLYAGHVHGYGPHLPRPASQAPELGVPIGYAYPGGYNEYGYCGAHNAPYPCRWCGPLGR